MPNLDDNIGRAADPRLTRQGSVAPAAARAQVLARMIERGRIHRPAAGRLAHLPMRMVRRSPLIGAATATAQALMRRFHHNVSGSTRELTLIARIVGREAWEDDGDQTARESRLGRMPIAQRVISANDGALPVARPTRVGPGRGDAADLRIAPRTAQTLISGTIARSAARATQASAPLPTMLRRSFTQRIAERASPSTLPQHPLSSLRANIRYAFAGPMLQRLSASSPAPAQAESERRSSGLPNLALLQPMRVQPFGAGMAGGSARAQRRSDLRQPGAHILNSSAAAYAALPFAPPAATPALRMALPVSAPLFTASRISPLAQHTPGAPDRLRASHSQRDAIREASLVRRISSRAAEASDAVSSSSAHRRSSIVDGHMPELLDNSLHIARWPELLAPTQAYTATNAASTPPYAKHHTIVRQLASFVTPVSRQPALRRSTLAGPASRSPGRAPTLSRLSVLTYAGARPGVRAVSSSARDQRGQKGILERLPHLPLVKEMAAQTRTALRKSITDSGDDRQRTIDDGVTVHHLSSIVDSREAFPSAYTRALATPAVERPFVRALQRFVNEASSVTIRAPRGRPRDTAPDVAPPLALTQAALARAALFGDGKRQSIHRMLATSAGAADRTHASSSANATMVQRILRPRATTANSPTGGLPDSFVQRILRPRATLDNNSIAGWPGPFVQPGFGSGEQPNHEQGIPAHRTSKDVATALFVQRQWLPLVMSQAAGLGHAWATRGALTPTLQGARADRVLARSTSGYMQRQAVIAGSEQLAASEGRSHMLPSLPQTPSMRFVQALQRIVQAPALGRVGHVAEAGAQATQTRGAALTSVYRTGGRTRFDTEYWQAAHDSAKDIVRPQQRFGAVQRSMPGSSLSDLLVRAARRSSSVSATNETSTSSIARRQSHQAATTADLTPVQRWASAQRASSSAYHPGQWQTPVQRALSPDDNATMEEQAPAWAAPWVAAHGQTATQIAQRYARAGSAAAHSSGTLAAMRWVGPIAAQIGAQPTESDPAAAPRQPSSTSQLAPTSARRRAEQATVMDLLQPLRVPTPSQAEAQPPLSAANTAQRAMPQVEQAGPEISIEALARQVYTRLRHRLLIEAERLG